MIPASYRPFLRSIRESPNDEVRRQIFADFLEETGDDEYAAVIRGRMQMSWGLHMQLSLAVTTTNYDRGIATSVVCHIRDWSNAGPTICDLWPIQSLWISPVITYADLVTIYPSLRQHLYTHNCVASRQYRNRGELALQWAKDHASRLRSH